MDFEQFGSNRAEIDKSEADLVDICFNVGFKLCARESGEPTDETLGAWQEANGEKLKNMFERNPGLLERAKVDPDDVLDEIQEELRK